MYCDDFKSGSYCEIIKAFAPKSYCAVCPKYQGDIKYPPLATMAKGFIKAAARHVKSGFKTRTKEERDACIAICKQCNYFAEATLTGPRCKICGCGMSLKKRWATAHCNLKPPRW